jgi:hypothetical protein
MHVSPTNPPGMRHSSLIRAVFIKRIDEIAAPEKRKNKTLLRQIQLEGSHTRKSASLNT